MFENRQKNDKVENMSAISLYERKFFISNFTLKWKKYGMLRTKNIIHLKVLMKEHFVSWFLAKCLIVSFFPK